MTGKLVEAETAFIDDSEELQTLRKDDDEDSTSKKVSRDQWGNQLEFILTIVGYTVGLGNVWRYPYLAYNNGGGSFVFAYWCCSAMVGFTAFLMELTLGQYGRKGPLTAWGIIPIFKGIGDKDIQATQTSTSSSESVQQAFPGGEYASPKQIFLSTNALSLAFEKSLPDR